MNPYSLAGDPWDTHDAAADCRHCGRRDAAAYCPDCDYDS